MKKNFLLAVGLATGLTACSAFENGTPKRTVTQVPAEETTGMSEENTIQTPAPVFILEQDVENCSEGSEACSIQSITEPFDNSGGTKFRINSVLVVEDQSVLTAPNTDTAPVIKFKIQDIEDKDINSLTYSYEKRDNTGNVLFQNPAKTLYKSGDFYSVPVHVSTLGSGILTSAPYEKHVLTVRLITSDNSHYSYDVEFYIYSHAENPVLMERKTDVLNSSYYKMDEELADYVIDIIEIENTLPYPVILSGDVKVNNSTTAFLSDTYYTQQKTFVPKGLDFYPWDTWNMHIVTNTKYYLAQANPVLSVVVFRGENQEPLPVVSSYVNNEMVLSYNGLNLQGYEKVTLKVKAGMDLNNYILGPHGQKDFYEGNTYCSDISPVSMCRCYYFTANQHCTSQLQANMLYGLYMCGGFNLAAKNYQYGSPECEALANNNTCLTKNVDLIYYPLDTYSLAGRRHTTNITYVMTSWLAGYENYDELGTTTKVMDVLDASKGITDTQLLDLSQIFSGYIPGLL